MTRTNMQSIEQIVKDPKLYGSGLDSVEVVETHISIVVLTDEHAYKFKKPVDFGFLDFSTLDQRRHYCEQEVELNRRLCSDVYLGVVALIAVAGEFRLGQPDDDEMIVDYAVKMKRLPADRMMDHLLDAGELSDSMVEDLARKIAQFHANSAGSKKIDEFGSVEVIRENWAENFEQTSEFVGAALSEYAYEYIQRWVHGFITRNQDVFRSRVSSGLIRDCHGDLRMSAVCFQSDTEICVYDCIEFNERFRFSDVAADIAFLAMDLDFNDQQQLGSTFVEAYRRESGEPLPDDLLDFYKCYRAFVRGKVEMFQADAEDADHPRHDESLLRAQRYFKLATKYAEAHPLPNLIFMCGLSGSGKSTLAREIAAGLQAGWIRSDAVRKELAGLDAEDSARTDYGEGIYSQEHTQRTYRAMLDRAKTLLRDGQSVILDATYTGRANREAVIELAEEVGALAFCIEITATEDVIRQRLQARQDGSVSDARWDTYLKQRSTFESPDELSDWARIRVDGDLDISDLSRLTMGSIQRRVRPASHNTPVEIKH